MNIYENLFSRLNEIFRIVYAHICIYTINYKMSKKSLCCYVVKLRIYLINQYI